jgi:hypothetical protein
MADVTNHKHRGPGAEERQTARGAAVDDTGFEPYEPPRLRHLGSVRELTLGSGTAGPDGDCATTGSPVSLC